MQISIEFHPPNYEFPQSSLCYPGWSLILGLQILNMIVKCGNLEPTKATLKDRGNFKNTIHTRENFKGLTFETMHFEFTHFTDNKFQKT